MAKIQNPNQLLDFYINHSSKVGFGRLYDVNNNQAFTNNVKKFFDSKLDEVRLYYADKCTEFLLSSHDALHLMHFCKGLLRKELSKDIDYRRHRDHSSHTLNNFFLGWFIFSKSKILHEEFKIKFGQRFDLSSWPMFQIFGNLWPLVSLLHDIGYLFEGSLTATSTEVQNARVKRGSAVVDDYFSHVFWIERGMPSLDSRKILKELSGYELEKFSYTTMGEVSDSLRSLGSLEKLRRKIHEESKRIKKIKFHRIIKEEYGLPFDSFDLWKKNYETHNNKSMMERIDHMENLFHQLIYVGMPRNGVRVVDHGVAGGLLLLKSLTEFYKLLFGLPDSIPKDVKNLEVWKLFKRERIPDRVHYTAWFWWKGIVWATCATALHNILQLKEPSYDPKKKIKPLSIKEDPLAYLGVLVDILEEWDRFTVQRESMFTNELPVQSVDVKMKFENGVLKIDYGDKRINRKVTESLKYSLKQSGKIVKICNL